MERWTDERVKQYIKGKSVVVIGSAPSCLDNNAKFIESHDIIIRVNNYKTKGNDKGRMYDFTSKVGSRTDIHYSFYGSSIRTPQKRLIDEGVKLCMCKCPNSRPIYSKWHIERNMIRGIDFRYIYVNREKDNYFPCPVWIPSDVHFLKTFNMLGKHVPTTGFSAVIDTLSFEPKSVYVTGFDGFKSGKHNVNELWKHKNNDDPIKHLPNEEMKIFKNLNEQGKITVDNRLKQIFTEIQK